MVKATGSHAVSSKNTAKKSVIKKPAAKRAAPKAPAAKKPAAKKPAVKKQATKAAPKSKPASPKGKVSVQSTTRAAAKAAVKPKTPTRAASQSGKPKLAAPAKPVAKTTKAAGKAAAPSSHKPASKSAQKPQKPVKVAISAKSASARSVGPKPTATSPKPKAKDALTATPKTTSKAPPAASPAPAAASQAAATPAAPPVATRGRGAGKNKAVVTSNPDIEMPTYQFTPVAPPPVVATPVKRKFDAKLSNAWKAKAGADLTDEEVLAMPDEAYMNDKQLAFFRHKLVMLKSDLLSNADETTEHLREDTVIVPDPADRATIEEEHALELRTRDRERKLLKKIEQAITRIDAGDYGYCDETGEEIGVARLIARPTATLSLEAQQRREMKQKMFGD
jgi:DnaK suppressor protein